MIEIHGSQPRPRIASYAYICASDNSERLPIAEREYREDRIPLPRKGIGGNLTASDPRRASQRLGKISDAIDFKRRGHHKRSTKPRPQLLTKHLAFLK